MTRKERKEEANERRLDIADQLRKYLAEVSKTISDEMGPYGTFDLILRRGDRWVNDHMRRYPQEAHMYKSAAIIIKNAIQEILQETLKKGGKDG